MTNIVKALVKYEDEDEGDKNMIALIEKHYGKPKRSKQYGKPKLSKQYGKPKRP